MKKNLHRKRKYVDAGKGEALNPSQTEDRFKIYDKINKKFVEICRDLKIACRIPDSTNGVVFMAERIAEEKINQIRQAVDIVEVISDYVQLKKQGRNYFGLCPFHGESTPSFSVSIDKQIFHCFGCGAGGNVFSFLMELEGISFQEAAIKLASKVNIDLEINLSGGQGEKKVSQEHQAFLGAHELLQKFYHHLLVNTKEGEQALEYLLEQGIYSRID